MKSTAATSDPWFGGHLDVTEPKRTGGVGCCDAPWSLRLPSAARGGGAHGLRSSGVRPRRRLRAARDKARANAGDVLAAVAVAAYFLDFFGAVHLAQAKLSY